MLAAFWVFAAACLSDAADGFIAKRFNLQSELGGFLDPLADKALLVSVFITLGIAGYIESWVVILIVFRDGLILAGASVYQVLFQDLTMQPLTISKINTTFQFLLAAGVLGAGGFAMDMSFELQLLSYAVGLTTVLSGGAYVIIWGRRATVLEPGE